MIISVYETEAEQSVKGSTDLDDLDFGNYDEDELEADDTGGSASEDEDTKNDQ